MSSSMREQLDEAMDEVRAQQRRLQEARRKAAAATVSLRSQDRLLTVTVAGQGEVRDIAFHSTDYAAMAPAQLSAVLVETINTARAQLAEQVRATFEPLSTVGTALRSSMLGGSEAGDLMGAIRELMRPPGESGTGTATPDEED
jgi:DNA-binding protein YbaB